MVNQYLGSKFSYIQQFTQRYSQIKGEILNSITLCHKISCILQEKDTLGFKVCLFLIYLHNSKFLFQTKKKRKNLVCNYKHYNFES